MTSTTTGGTVTPITAATGRRRLVTIHKGCCHTSFQADSLEGAEEAHDLHHNTRLIRKVIADYRQEWLVNYTRQVSKVLAERDVFLEVAAALGKDLMADLITEKGDLDWDVFSTADLLMDRASL